MVDKGRLKLEEQETAQSYSTPSSLSLKLNAKAEEMRVDCGCDNDDVKSVEQEIKVDESHYSSRWRR